MNYYNKAKGFMLRNARPRGFILKYADQGTALYTLACDLTREAMHYFEDRFPLESMHEAACFVELYDYMKACDCSELIDLARFKALLNQQIKQLITYDTTRWNMKYIKAFEG